MSFTLDLNDREEQGEDEGHQCKIVQQLIAHGKLNSFDFIVVNPEPVEGDEQGMVFDNYCQFMCF